MGLTRRGFLERLGAVGGYSAVYLGMEAMGLLNEIGFAVTEDNLLAPEQQDQTDITVAYDPAEPDGLAAALTVASAVPGATLVATEGLGGQVQLLLGESYDGTVASVQVGVPATGTIGATSTAESPSDESSVPSLTAGDLPSINAGEELCA